MAGPTLEIELPYLWKPRRYQGRLWSYLEAGGTRAIALWPRRSGKDEVALRWTSCAAHTKIGNYWHLLPEARQGQKVLWEAVNPHSGKRRIDEVFPPPLRETVRNDEMLIRLKSGSTWQVVGSDNYDSLIGAPPIGVVFSEYAVAKPAAWDYIRPILAENGGWALFAYTPRGPNHGLDLFEMATKNPAWFAERLTVDDTGVPGPDVIAEERRSGMSEELIKQEYYCSFTAATVGSYYGELLNAAQDEGRISPTPYTPGALVTTAWDLGYGDDTAIWFAQVIGREERVIDYYENRGMPLDHYAKIVRSKPYTYGRHLLPHDGAKGELISGTTIVKEATDLLGRGVEVLPRISVEDGINAARVLLQRCRIDNTRCEQGLKALRLYRRAYNEERKVFSDRPMHDWTSHASDAFRYLALGLKPDAAKRQPAQNWRRAEGAQSWMGS
jgi:hypothetical protein